MNKIETIITSTPLTPTTEVGIEYLRNEARLECRAVHRRIDGGGLSAWRAVDRASGRVTVTAPQPLHLAGLPDEKQGWRWLEPLVIEIPSIHPAIHPAPQRACSARAGRRASLLHHAARVSKAAGWSAAPGGQRWRIAAATTPSQRRRQRAQDAASR